MKRTCIIALGAYKCVCGAKAYPAHVTKLNGKQVFKCERCCPCAAEKGAAGK
jgi:hypothetical protein